MIIRDLASELLSASSEYPVTTIFGPRQSGKTTLAKTTFPDKPYQSLEDPEIRSVAELDPRGFLNNLPQGGILDEIQRAPHLLSYIQGIVDSKKTPGMFILTGSHQPLLHQAVSQSLAGRTAILTLLPLSLNELKAVHGQHSAFELIHSGCFPRLHDKRLQISRFFNSYVQTYLERDVRSLINIHDLGRFQQFLTLLAGRIGQLINYASLANDTGVSATTIKSWISVLKASYIVFELQPYFENISKRVMKASKIYFTDTGLASFLLGITSGEQFARDPLRGGLFENFIILEFLKARYNRGSASDMFFYRDSHGNEVDLVLKNGRMVRPIEIKSASTFNDSFLKGIKHFRETTGADRCENGAIIYNGDLDTTIHNIAVINLFRDKSARDLLTV